MYKVHNTTNKTSSPFQYILQAAMGQCSNLHADGKNKEEVATSGNRKVHRGYSGRHTSSSRRLNHQEQRDSVGYQSYGHTDNDERHNDTDVMMEEVQNERSSHDFSISVNNAQLQEDNLNLSPRHGRVSGRYPAVREEVFPPPPPGSVRTRCYRLNLDAPVILSPTHDHLGPMPYEPPVHLLPTSQQRSHQIFQTNSSESIEKSPTQVAIHTARIFRGITVDKNGTILSQNARATRSSRGGKDKTKQAGASRQQEKINKAKDLVDETIGGKENDAQKSNMVSLVIIGEYDEMKQLVRDGAKKLRDAEGLPDEALLAINRPRLTTPQTISSSSVSSRKRFSQKSSGDSFDARSKSRNRMSPLSSSSHSMPKLKSHPRDRPSSRRLGSPGGVDSEGKRRLNSAYGDKCNDMNIFGGGNSDWSNALGFSKGFDTIWNCGATGAKSPNSNNSIPSPSERRSSNKVRYDGRNDSSARFSRGGGVAIERDPVSKDVMIL